LKKNTLNLGLSNHNIQNWKTQSLKSSKPMVN
jgi:hypothetical protein